MVPKRLKKTKKTKSNDSSVSNNNTFAAGLMPSGGDYFSDSYFEDSPKNQYWRQRMIEEMKSFGKNKSNLFLVDFCESFGIPRQRLYKLKDKYPDIAEAFEDMMMRIGRNREMKAPMQYVMQHTQYLYDAQWAAGEERRVDLVRKANETKVNQGMISAQLTVDPETYALWKEKQQQNIQSASEVPKVESNQDE
jgi:hypothetical protein